MSSTPTFQISRHFSASRQRVWNAWTKPEALGRWFGPKGSSSDLIAYDLRPGGVWRGKMQMPDGGTAYSKFVFQVVEPISRLEWVHGFSDENGNRVRAPFAPLFPLELATSVQFSDDGEGTRIDLTWTPLNATAEEESFFASMMVSMNGGWTSSFDQLDEFLLA